jgi:hypothetical protein
MLDSLKKYAHPFKLYVLSLDDFTYQYLKKEGSQSIIPVSIGELEEADPELNASKSNRSRVEYFFTLSPCLPLFILNKYPEIDKITYLDSDLYFFSNIKPIYEELGDKSIYTIPHRFPERHKEMEIYGLYNVGFQIFKNDQVGRSCLLRWRAQCIDWCYDKLEGEKFADQKYLNEWPALYNDALVISQNPGANLAPWNVNAFNLDIENGKIKVNGSDLIFYHFHRLRFLNSRLLTHGLDNYHVIPDQILKNHIYAPYIGALRRKNTELQLHTDKTERLYKKYTLNELKKLLKKGHTFFYINDKKVIRFKWIFF